VGRVIAFALGAYHDVVERTHALWGHSGFSVHNPVRARQGQETGESLPGKGVVLGERPLLADCRLSSWGRFERACHLTTACRATHRERRAPEAGR
jgi:hypothetical protein